MKYLLPLPRLPYLGLVLGLSAPLVAQQTGGRQGDDSVYDLDAFEVSSDGDVGYHSTHAAEATRMNMPIADIPMSVVILNQEFIEDTMARSTEDVLEYVPGFIPESNNDNWVIRGFANANTKFLNGFEQQESIGKVSVANIERVEVLRGPAAVLFGPGGYAATVNRITKRPLDKANTMIRLGYGPMESMRLEFDTTGPIGKSAFSYRVTGVLDDGEYYRKISHDEKALGASLSWRIGPSTRLTLEGLYVIETDGGAVWRQPVFRGDYKGFELADGTYLSYGKNRQGYSAPGDLREWKRGFAMADLQHKFNRNIQLRLQYAIDTKDQFYDETQPEQGSLTFLKDAVLMPKLWRVRTQDVFNQRLRNELVIRFETGPLTHRLLAGLSWEQSDAESHFQTTAYNRGGLGATAANLNARWPTANNIGSRFNNYPNLTLAQFLADVRLAGFNPHLVPPINVIDPSRSPRWEIDRNDPPPLRTTRDLVDDVENTSFYLSNMVSFDRDRFFITGGLRRVQAKDERFDRQVDAITRSDKAYATTYSAGAVYHILRDQRLTWYANANSSFLPEFRRQPDGTSLPPEEGNQIETGLRFSLRQDRIQGMISIYEIRQQNVAITDPDETDWYLLIDGLRSRGFEFSVNARLTDNWRLYGGYAYTDARDADTKQRVYAVPYNHFTAFSRYTFNLGRRQNLDVMLGTIFIDRRPVEYTPITSLGGIANAPHWEMPAVWRFDLMARYRWRQRGSESRYEVRAKIQNLFDNQDIVKRADRVSMQLQPGRTIQVDFRVRF
jgi:iron complex outermembrane recepter protein